MPKIIDLLKQLEAQETYNLGRKQITTFEGAANSTLYKNSYLLAAIVLGYVNAAIDILTICNRQGLNYKDGFSGSRSNALILCAKTGLNPVAMLLIGLGADVNQTDYRGYSALHYACMYRNEALIRALLAAGASTKTKNCFGKNLIYYYNLEIKASDLAYPYGHGENFALTIKYDHGQEDFKGTEVADFSALRWFIHHVIVNFKWGINDKFFSSEPNPAINMFWDNDKLTFSDNHLSVYEFAKE